MISSWFITLFILPFILKLLLRIAFDHLRLLWVNYKACLPGLSLNGALLLFQILTFELILGCYNLIIVGRRHRGLVSRRWEYLVIEKFFVQVSISFSVVNECAIIHILVYLLLGLDLLELLISRSKWILWNIILIYFLGIRIF